MPGPTQLARLPVEALVLQRVEQRVELRVELRVEPPPEEGAALPQGMPASAISAKLKPGPVAAILRAAVR